eukprot:15080863-Alexandrium_andersonii.AAC.1
MSCSSVSQKRTRRSVSSPLSAVNAMVRTASGVSARRNSMALLSSSVPFRCSVTHRAVRTSAREPLEHRSAKA